MQVTETIEFNVGSGEILTLEITGHEVQIITSPNVYLNKYELQELVDRLCVIVDWLPIPNDDEDE